MPRSRLAFYLLLSLLTLSSVLFGAAQTNKAPIEAQAVVVDIWPEYDRTAVLVIYTIRLSPQVKLPATISLSIPRAATTLYQASYYVGSSDSAPTPLNVQTISGVDWTQIKLTAPTSLIRLEFYDPRLLINETTRTYTYIWPADFTVDDLTVRIQNPIGATQMEITPHLGGGSLGEDGLIYYETTIGKVDVGMPFNLALTYQKSDRTLTFTTQPVSAASPLDEHIAGRTRLVTILPWLIVGFLLLVALMLGVWITWRRMNPEWVEKYRPVWARQLRSKNNLSHDTAVFCPECGKRAETSDLYCRVCGTRLRGRTAETH